MVHIKSIYLKWKPYSLFTINQFTEIQLTQLYIYTVFIKNLRTMTILKVGTSFVLSVYNISTHWWHKITQKWIVLLLMASSSMSAFWPVNVISCNTIYNLLQKQMYICSSITLCMLHHKCFYYLYTQDIYLYLYLY